MIYKSTINKGDGNRGCMLASRVGMMDVHPQDLVASIKRGEVSRVLAMLDLPGARYTDVLNWQDVDDGTPLYWASCCGYSDVVQRLIDIGAGVNVPTIWKATPLHASADNNHAHVCRILLENKANVNAQTSQGITACHLAAYRGLTTIVQLLVNAGSDVTLVNKHGKTSLDEARGAGHLAIAKLLEQTMGHQLKDTQSTYGYEHNSNGLVNSHRPHQQTQSFMNNPTTHHLNDSFKNEAVKVQQCSGYSENSYEIVPSKQSYDSIISGISSIDFRRGRNLHNVVTPQNPHHTYSGQDLTKQRHKSFDGWNVPSDKTELQFRRKLSSDSACDEHLSKSKFGTGSLNCYNPSTSSNFNSVEYSHFKDHVYNKNIDFSVFK